ncbi:alpha-amylase family glycosyl hydrolase, partial [Candidatus Riflebacteria bacterium]
MCNLKNTVFFILLFAVGVSGISAGDYWFENAIIYQVFIKSFKDSDGDGIGDIKGLGSKLDYIKDLGATALYLNPVTAANFHDRFTREDLGYAAIDLKRVEPSYGTIADFKGLVQKAHQKNIRIIIDFINLGVSRKHPYFLEAVNDPASRYCRFFMIRDKKPAGRWLAYGNKAKGWYPLPDGRYYYSLFGGEKNGGLPAFNYHHGEVVDYLFSVADFWLACGVDGFRLDAAKFLFANGPGTEKQEHQPQTFVYWRQFKKRMIQHYGRDKILIGEILPVPVEHDYIGKNREMLDFLMDGTLSEAVFSFQKIELNKLPPRYINSFLGEGLLRSRNKVVYLSNHDRGRIAAKVPGDELKVKKMLANIQFLANGTPSVYFGDEIGLTGDKSKNYYESTNFLSAMAWDVSKNGGFSSSDKPRPPVSPDFRIHNVQMALNDPGSLLNHYRMLSAFRKKYPIFARGEYKKVRQLHRRVYHYLLHTEEEVVLVVHNLSDTGSEWVCDLSTYAKVNDLMQIFPGHSLEYGYSKGHLTLAGMPPYSSAAFILKNVKRDDLVKSDNLDFSRVETLHAGAESKAAKNAVYRFPAAIKDAGIYLQQLDKSLKINLFDKDRKLKNEIYLTEGKNITVPFSFDTAYFNLNNTVSFQLLPVNWKVLFSEKARKKGEHPDNRTLRAFYCAADDNFWYLKIEKKELCLPKNGGFDLAIFIDDPGIEIGAKKLAFWLLPAIQATKSIEHMVGFQYGMREKKPLFYSDITREIQPGVRTFTNIIYHETGDSFYMLLNRNELPAANYNIAIVCWSAGKSQKASFL